MLTKSKTRAEPDTVWTRAASVVPLLLVAAIVIGFRAGPTRDVQAQSPGTDASAFDANDEVNEVIVTGRVVDSQGDPISDATIVHSFYDQDIREDVEFTTASDETGRFRMRTRNSASSDAILLWAYGSGHSVRVVTHWLGQENEITLSEMEAIEITITKSDGTPVADASITPRSHPVPNSIHPQGIFTRPKESDVSLLIPEAIASQLTVTSDDSGHCVLQGVPRTLLQSLLIRTDGFGEQEVRFGSQEDTGVPLVIALVGVGSVSMKVPGAEPALLAGRPVRLRTRFSRSDLAMWERLKSPSRTPGEAIQRLQRRSADGQESMWASISSSREGTFNEEGVCVIKDVPEGRLSVYFDADDFSDALPKLEDARNLRVLSGQETQVVIPMVKVVELRGRVVADGQGVAGARVSAYTSDGGIRPYTSTEIYSVDTDEQGRYRVRSLPGEVRLRASTGDRDLVGRFQPTQSRSISADATVTMVPDIELSPLPEKEAHVGRVIDQQGAPITSGYVAVLANESFGMMHHCGDAPDATGGVEFSCWPLNWRFTDGSPVANFLDVLERVESDPAMVEVVLYPSKQSVRREDRSRFPRLKLVTREPLVFQVVGDETTPE